MTVQSKTFQKPMSKINLQRMLPRLSDAKTQEGFHSKNINSFPLSSDHLWRKTFFNTVKQAYVGALL